MSRKPIIDDDLYRPLELSDYDEAKDEFVEICESAQIDHNHIGFFGGVSFPSISDIDAIVVGNSPQLKKLKELFDNKRAQSAPFATMFWHDPVYMLESVWEDGRQLHTLNELSPLRHSSFFCKNNTHLTDNQIRSLNAVWFSFLLRIAAGLPRWKRVPLRLLLLVYKNLEYSNKIFAKHEDNNSNLKLSSSDLRKRVLAQTEGDYGWVLDAFEELLNSTLKHFDEYCYVNFSQENTVGIKRPRCLFLAKNVVLKSSSKTSIKYFSRLIIINVNSVMFDLAAQFFFKKSSEGFFSRYLSSSYKCIAAYDAEKLQYPFITPFVISPNRKIWLREINRFCGVWNRILSK